MRTGTTRKMRWMARGMALLGGVPTIGLWLLTAPAQAQQQINEANKPKIVSELKPGTTDKLTPTQWKIVDAKRAQEQAKKEASKPDVRLLSKKEMQKWHGSGPYRSKYYAGTLPWHRSLRDANLCNGNLFKSFTDIQVAPAKGAGLALQRTYNSQDDRPGPFGTGWTHAYDIRMEEEYPTTNDTDPALNYTDRSDFFGAKHKYHRDADGLYSPPPYLFDETQSGYDAFLVNGPITVQTDTQTAMDGTIKHFSAIGTARFCDYIQDRHGNQTTLAYIAVVDNGATANLLSTVTDPSNRTLTFTWHNLGTSAQPIWRITQVDGPQYSVAYAYNVDANLSSVTLDPGLSPHLNRTTTFGYTTVTGPNGTEAGLLASVTDALGHTISYTYAIPAANPTNTVWVSSVVEPAGVDTNNVQRTQTWQISPGSFSNALMLVTFTTGAVNATTGFGALLAVDTLFHNQGYHDLNYVAGNSDGWAHYTVYDSASNVTNTSEYIDAFVGLTGRHDAYTYGPHGNQLTHTVSLYPGVDTTTYYDASQYFQKKSVTDMNGHTTTLGVGSKYDSNPGNRGSVLWVKDAKYGDGTLNNTGTRFSYTYNTQGQKTSETNQNGIVTNYTYGDAWGNLTQIVQDPGGLNRITSMQYDIAGHVLQSTDPSGQVSTFQYNVLGQPNQASFPAKGSSPAETVTYGYGTNGRMETVTDGRGQTSMAYENGCDRVKSVTDPVTGMTSYTYGVTGERRTMALPGGGTWTYAYVNDGGLLSAYDMNWAKDDPNALSRKLQSTTDDQGRRIDVYLSDYLLYNDAAITSTRTNQTFDVSNPNNPILKSYQASDYLYDSPQNNNTTTRHWITQVKNTWHYTDAQGAAQSSLLFQNDYTYNNAGQRLTNKITSSDGSFRTEQYGYDELNRLKTVDYGDGQTQSYTFDAMGNRASKTDVGGGINGTENYTVNNANMLLTRGTAAYTNDANGNTLTDPTHTNTWDSENRLAKCVTTGANAAISTFVYGSDGIRHSSTITTGGTTTITNFVLDNSMFVREQQAGANYATYLFGARGPEYRRQDSGANAGQVRWYVYDGLGSVLAEVDPTGNITSKRKYDVYGLVRNAGVVGDNAGGTSVHKFVGALGHPSEDSTGYIYMRARYMDPTVGRFVRQDPKRHGTKGLSTK